MTRNDTWCRMFLWPPPMTANPTEVFRGLENSFLHPDVNRLLAGFLLQAETPVRELKLHALSLKECDRLLDSLLPNSYKTAGAPILTFRSRWVRMLPVLIF